MELEWNLTKAASNLRKHDVSFEEACTSLLDPNALAHEDQDAAGEHRWVLIGMSSSARLLTVVYTVREEESIRIISARKATKKESEFYA